MIDEITQEQKDQVDLYLKKWLDIGHQTNEMDQGKAKKAVEFLYEKILEINTPEIHFVKSPMEAIKLCNKLVNNIEYDSKENLEYFEVARGNWWLSYYAFNDYLLNVIFPEKISEFNKFTEFLEHSKNFHLLWTFDTFAVICDFPTVINLDDDKKLHSNFSGALIYRDGNSIYARNGRTMLKKEWDEETKRLHSKIGSMIFEDL